VNVVGGCCGTTPEHIAALAEEAEEAPSLVSYRLNSELNSFLIRYAQFHFLTQ
jgi:hypothetical protein